MKLILVHISPIIKYPPALTVLQYLSELGIDLTLCTTDIDEVTAGICEKYRINVINIEANYNKTIPPLLKLVRMRRIRKEAWKAIDNIYDSDSVIWVFSDLALKHLGKRLLNRRFILQMFELSEKTIYYRKFPMLSLNTKKYAKRSLCVIQSEYNRAHIAKSWWELDNLPFVLPNKPYIKKRLSKKLPISSQVAAEIIHSLEGKKIILYQGIISPERPLDKIIKAVNMLGEDYAFVIMSSGKDIYKNIGSDNYYFIPFISPPYHLEVTSHAYIGVLSYQPSHNEYSKLNALYCAPNKIYEYSMFGIPMIGNDVPGLSYVFERNKCGFCFKEFEETFIINAIKKIESNYEFMGAQAKVFYNETDIKEKIQEVINFTSNMIE